MIKRAYLRNAKDIVRIVNSVFIDNIKSDKNGFLMARGGKKYYESLIKQSKFCYVAIKNEKVVGFLIAYRKALLNKKDDIHRYFLRNYPNDDFIYISQVAIVPEYQHQGFGEKLYQRLFKDARGIKKLVVTSAKPYNKASEKFHLKVGFKKIGRLKRDDGGLSIAYLKKS